MSAPTKSAARAARRAVEDGDVGGASEARKRRGREDFLRKGRRESARLSSPGPHLSDGLDAFGPRATRRTPQRRRAPHSLSTFEEKGCSSANGRDPCCASQESTTGSSLSTRCLTSGVRSKPARPVTCSASARIRSRTWGRTAGSTSTRSSVARQFTRSVAVFQPNPTLRRAPRAASGHERRLEQTLRIHDEVETGTFPLLPFQEIPKSLLSSLCRTPRRRHPRVSTGRTSSTYGAPCRRAARAGARSPR